MVGLRPGEKLYEELMMDVGAGLRCAAPSTTKFLWQAPAPSTWRSFYEQLQALEAAAAHNDEGVVKQLAAMIPTFTPTRKNLKT